MVTLSKQSLETANPALERGFLQIAAHESRVDILALASMEIALLKIAFAEIG